MSDRVRVFVGLGSNLGDPCEQLRRALQALRRIPGTRLVASSCLYRSEPLGPPDQPDYINAVAELETALAPETLLDALQAIEAAQGRARSEKWGPRTLDLDILIYGDRVIATQRLCVPHPGLPERHFVLYPLAELEPELQVPGMGRVRDLADRTSAAGIERLDMKTGSTRDALH